MQHGNEWGAEGAHGAGGVPGEVLLRSAGLVTAAGAVADAAAACLPFARGGGGRPSSTVLWHSSHLQCTPQFTPACRDKYISCARSPLHMLDMPV